MIKLAFRRAIIRFIRFLEKQETFYLHDSAVHRGLIKIGCHSYGIPRLDIYKGSECRVTIGNFTSLSRGVTIVTGGIHPTDWVSTFPFRIKWKMPRAYEDGMPHTNGDVTIGSDVWIGTEVLILSGVTIGDGAIVAARSVVTKNVAPYSIVGGVPAKLIRYRFTADTIKKLMALEWWNWDEIKISEAIPLLSSNNIKMFINKHC